MSDAAPSTFRKVISNQQFVGRPLITSTIAVIAAALLLIGIILCAAGVTELLTLRMLAEDRGLLPTAEGLADGPVNRILIHLILAIPLLHESGSTLTFLFGGAAALLVLRGILRGYAQTRISHHVAAAVKRLREHIHRHALRSNPGDLAGVQHRASASLFRQTAQTLEDSSRAWGFRQLTSTCDIVVLVILLLATQWRVGLECVVPVIVCWFVYRLETERHETSSSLLAEQMERGVQKLTDDLDKAQIVAGYGMENLEHEQFSSSLHLYQQRREHLHRQLLRGRWVSLVIVIVSVTVPGFLIARHLLFGSAIGPAAAVTLTTLVVLITLSLQRMQEVPVLAGTAIVAADEINQFLLRVPSVSQVVGAKFLEPMSRSLQFNQVSVETETHPELISNLDLKFESGQRVAILALDTHEAEALVSLIPRFRDPQHGQVLIDGQDIRRVTLESLRAEAVTVGGQEPVFSATVLENITAGQSEISRQDAIEASKSVHAESFIRQLPKGYETPLGEHGVLLEPGQVFRLSLARAVARKPALLVIQEPEATLDEETKAMLDDAYQRICNGRTVLFLPSRLSTVKKCSRLVLIHQGRVAADGTHEELMRSSELYRHWEYMRFNVFR
ncbi:MAG: ABC transporter ATP-binding protein [Fuerstiella sp.]|nr:ABC transporter ATP-binding protein [Fuerstiella sp.]MCP4856511.1 ABC transporter ATP-binding protein [Fuerstiella sp.]